MERGYKEITLLGQNVNAFGLDFGAPGKRLGLPGFYRESTAYGLYGIGTSRPIPVTSRKRW